jgi:hypothetical protein
MKEDFFEALLALGMMALGVTIFILLLGAFDAIGIPRPDDATAQSLLGMWAGAFIVWGVLILIS